MLIRDLGDGLILRRATPADTEALVAFNADVHRGHDAPEPDAGTAAWTRDLMAGTHPTFRTGDFTVVEDTRSGRIVSSLNLISQTWSYGGMPFGAGRIELVGTDPAYRRRGLVRAQFDVVHQWSAERGELVQGITGIPWYYRQFGYEYALDLEGGRGGSMSDVPALAEGAVEPYRVRPATESDLPFITEVYDHGRSRYLVSCVRDVRLWRLELSGRGELTIDRQQLCVIETPSGEPTGFLSHRAMLRRPQLAVLAYELAPGRSWLDVTPSVLRYLRAAGEALAARPGAARLAGYIFLQNLEHPAYRAAPERFTHVLEPYSWYIRVADLPAFLHRIAPVLEARLAGSEAAGYSGELRLAFFRDGLRLAFDHGRLTAAEPWPEQHYDTCSACFPDLTFLQLVFGYRSLTELNRTFADCIMRNETARVLLNALFPKQPSLVWAVM